MDRVAEESTAMVKTLQVTHRAEVDRFAEIVRHTNSPTCPKGMLEINPAFGCEFQCAYCGIYALEREYFGEVIVYDSFPAYLDDWLTKNPAAVKDKYFYLSAKTDCFQPALLESGITLEILKVLKKHQARYFLVTKAGLPPDDICEALVAARDINQVIISATMFDEGLRRVLEPGTAPLDERLALAEFAVENGIFVTASCCPVLPIGNREFLKDTFARIGAVGVKHFYFDFARFSREAVLNMIELLPEHREAFERHYFTPDAQVTRWHMPHRRKTIDKFQPPLGYMLAAFKDLADCVKEAVPGATVSVCNHFDTPETLDGFNTRARAECISCIGHRFADNGS